MANEMTTVDAVTMERIVRVARLADEDALEQACFAVLGFEYPETDPEEIVGMVAAELGAPGPGRRSYVELLCDLVNGCADSKGAAVEALLTLLEEGAS